MATDLTKKSNEAIQKNALSTEQETSIIELQDKYDAQLKVYTTEKEKQQKKYNEYVDRISPSNPYLNKFIQFPSGQKSYVTAMGVAKHLPNGVSNVFATKQTVRVDVPWKEEYSNAGAEIPTTPILISGTPLKEGEQVGMEGTNVFVNATSGIPAVNAVGCYTNVPNTWTDFGQMTLDECKKSAADGNMTYISFNSVQGDKGNCVASNSSLAEVTKGGKGVNSDLVVLWTSNTKGKGVSAALTNTGYLMVVDKTGKAIFATDSSQAKPTNYLGCYRDEPNRTMTLVNRGSQSYTLESCKNESKKAKATYYALQNSSSGRGGQCAISAEQDPNKGYGRAGLATNCTRLSDGTYSGGGWSNAVYFTDQPNSRYHLLLDDAGNMCIYRGINPSDPQGVIWCTGTQGKKKSADPTRVSKKSQFGRNYMISGEQLLPNQFVGSKDGSVYLFMNPNGELQLLTGVVNETCKAGQGGFMEGVTSVANYVYELVAGSVGNASNLGKSAYIDGDAVLHPYSVSETVGNDQYSLFRGMDSAGNDLPGGNFGNSSVDKCRQSCTNNPDCMGFVTTKDGTTCWTKGAGMYPYGAQRSFNADRMLYVRNRQPKAPLPGIPSSSSSIDALSYQRYLDGGALKAADVYSVAGMPWRNTELLEKESNKLDELAQQLAEKTAMLETNTTQVEGQSAENARQLQRQVREWKGLREQVQQEGFRPGNSYNNMLQDSDIEVLQKNYEYLLWSILATLTVMVAVRTQV